MYVLEIAFERRRYQSIFKNCIYFAIHFLLSHSSFHHFYWAAPFRARPVICSVFGCLCRITVFRGREDTRVWHRETMFSEVVSYDFPGPCTDPCTIIFHTSPPPPPRNPEGVAIKRGNTLRCSKRFNHRSHFISFVIVRV